MSSYIMYTIVSDCGRRSYVGITKNFTRRLKQHNGQIKGGARYTKGFSWRPAFIVKGFDKDRTVRQFEWRMHRKFGSGNGAPLERRIRQFSSLLQRPRATSSCTDTRCLNNLAIHWFLPSPAATLVPWPSFVRHYFPPDK